jgi:hypothetical protein
MKKLLIALTLLCMVVGGSALARNEIGIYTTPDADPLNASYEGAPGQFTAYVVLTEPWNDNTGTPIDVVGGFEFRLELPANVFLLAGVFPPATTNFATAPEYLCGSNIPVVNGLATLITLTLGEFSAVPGQIFISPVVVAPASVPGNIAITDFNDDFSISVATPSSGDFAEPIFGIYMGVVPTEDASWGEVKTLFR